MARISAHRLRGRRSECELLDRLVVRTRTGHSAVLVVHGEAGVGKSALLDYVCENAPGCRIARASGAEAEMELAFAGMHQLCAPFLDALDQLPSPQRDALATAFGLSAGDPPDRFLVGLAVLSLLAQIASERPLICVIDDAQWLDRVSTQTLAFVARRLVAERVALIFAVRELDEPAGLSGLPDLAVTGLSDTAARELLESTIPGRLDDRVRDRIVSETRGNPLALVELPRSWSPAELAGGFFERPDGRPLASRIEHTFVRRVRAMPSETQRLLLAAAAEPVGDVGLLMRAAQRLGIGADAAEPAEAAGLIELGARVRFRHPLVRSAAYRAGDVNDRRAAHRALAEATDLDTDPDRRAWHRAQAVVGPDEEVAAELERSAERAQRRGGVAAAAAFLQRATELSPDPATRSTRALAAARAKFEAAEPDVADALLAAAELRPLDAKQRALHARLRAQIVFARRRGRDAAPLLLDAARQLRPLDAALAGETLLEALAAAIYAGRLGGARVLGDAPTAARAAALPDHSDSVRPIDLLTEGIATVVTETYERGLPALRRAVSAFRSEPLNGQAATTRWLWLACPIAQEAAAHLLWDYDAWEDLAHRAVRLSRDTGALAFLPVALIYLAGVHLHAGDFSTASALIDEADAITAATGYAPVTYAALVLAAWRGDESRALTTIDIDVNDATLRGEGTVLALAGHAKAVLYNGLGRHDVALQAAREVCAHDDDLTFVGWSLAELVEAAARSGEHDEAVSAMARLEARTGASGTDWALGVQARSRALLSPARHVDDLYHEALERFERSRVAIHLARTHLLYGEWLRRENRRTHAREQLRAAHDMFSRMGAAAFAERARRELAVTGETVRRRSVESGDALTAQEAQIARLAGGGLTNPQIGAQLFLSPHTVEWHLRKVFAKLGVTSRRQLRTRLTDIAGQDAPI